MPDNPIRIYNNKNPKEYFFRVFILLAGWRLIIYNLNTLRTFIRNGKGYSIQKHEKQILLIQKKAILIWQFRFVFSMSIERLKQYQLIFQQPSITTFAIIRLNIA